MKTNTKHFPIIPRPFPDRGKILILVSHMIWLISRVQILEESDSPGLGPHAESAHGVTNNLDSDDSDASDYAEVDTFDCSKCQKSYVYEAARNVHEDGCEILPEAEGQLVTFEPIIRDPNKREPALIKQKRLEDAVCLITTGYPPYKCPDCMHDSFTPIEFLTHLGEDHFVVAERDEETFAPNKSNFLRQSGLPDAGTRF